MSVKINKASRWPQILAAFSATIGAFGMGTGLAWTSPALPALTDCEDNPDKPDGCTFDQEFTEEQGSWIGSSYTLGAMVSGLVTGYMLATIGRKYTMLIMAVPFTAGWVLLALTAPLDLGQPAYFYVGRALTGFGAGSFALACPIYIMEICEAEIRGSLGILTQFMVTAGNVFVNGFGSFLSWPIVTAICIVFPVMMFLLMLFMPRSPYILIVQEREKLARKNLQWLRGKKYDIEPEIQNMTDLAKEQEEIGGITFWELLTVAAYVKPFLIMMSIHFIQQFCGINAIVFYLADIFLAAGLSYDNSLAAAAEVSLTQVFATGVSIFVVERVGRRPLLLFSSSVMSISIFGLGSYFYVYDHVEQICSYSNETSTTTNWITTAEYECEPNDGFSEDLLDSLGWLPLTSLIIYKFAFSVGYGPLAWMMNGEFFPLEAKALSSAITTAFNWFCAFLISKFYVNIEQAIGRAGSYFMFAAICFVATIYVFFVVPETKGRSANDMRSYFEGHKRSSYDDNVTILNMKVIQE